MIPGTSTWINMVFKLTLRNEHMHIRARCTYKMKRATVVLVEQKKTQFPIAGLFKKCPVFIFHFINLFCCDHFKKCS